MKEKNTQLWIFCVIVSINFITKISIVKLQLFKLNNIRLHYFPLLSNHFVQNIDVLPLKLGHQSAFFVKFPFWKSFHKACLAPIEYPTPNSTFRPNPHNLHWSRIKLLGFCRNACSSHDWKPFPADYRCKCPN